MKVIRCLLAALMPVMSAVSVAQSVTVIGDSADARDCYFSAQIAIQMQSSSRSELEACSNALLSRNLRIRDRAATYVNRGILHAALEDYPGAIRDYARAKELYPEFGAIHVNRGNLYFLGESWESAIAEYSKALDIGLRQEYVAYLNRGMVYERIGRLSEAVADYRQAAELAPEWKLARHKLEKALLKRTVSPDPATP